MPIILILSSKKKISVIISLFLILLGVVTWFGFENYKVKNILTTIPYSIRQQVKYPILMPDNASKSIDRKTFAYANDIFQYVIIADDVSLTIFQQSKPKSFDLTGYSKSDNLSGAIIKPTSFGNLLIGKVSNYKVAILETEETIVTISTTEEVSNDKLLAIVNSLIQL